MPLPASPESVILANVGEAVVLTDWSNQSSKVGLPDSVMVLLASPVKRVNERAAVKLDPAVT